MTSQNSGEPNFASSGTGSASGSGSISSSQNDNASPLWNYVTKLEKKEAIGGTWNFRCNICGETRSGSYTRVKAHLLQISGGGVAICKKESSLSKGFYFCCNSRHSRLCAPGYNKLRTSLLLQEKSNVDKLLQPIKATWQEKGVTIVCDGWSDPTRKPLINFMATSGSGPMFLKAVNCFGEVKDKFFIANLMKEVIDEVGHQNVVQIITDNASNCKGAGEIIESMYPHIYWTPCVVHTLNLALKNICSA
ncbi:hypothetical protein V6N11_022049 [Hibiscus sabdariffa]|uniref:DUF659 domain-containing protein n=1 Tax=Hibiscus sabdariffa TaxID=183260 RepID=A0ABR2TIC7_9ROSI